MRHFKPFGILFLVVLGLFSCAQESSNSLETSPYFDLKGFINEKIQEVDGMQVRKISRIQGEEQKVELAYSILDWKQEFSTFAEADINNPSSIQSYETITSKDRLTHELLPDTKGKVKYIKVSYTGDQVSRVSIKIADDNLFYSTTTLAEIYMNNATHLIDHYSIETTQKIWFLDPNNMKIQGAIVQ
ncbi:hypothetical protein LV84_01140 [Algoriphagus ratkowskyi]|uniref:Uncharacterized protein n=1 Tax=Algoriphagus ratkowskyi TaxID=57028 RepID=A0A2W7RN81_9BACT|nr:hypothetical protein [Algoriphagus ratkowskyi]PZX59930.1 hypothetical protein LV84_01140 [Algoriphagus ratkowskyi]TXD78368.1 hypothetical protein ESW18_06135 [Algoriphagus ratkowskyi]